MKLPPDENNEGGGKIMGGERCCCYNKWHFTQNGYVDGGRGGDYYEYDDPAEFLGSPWTLDNLNLRMDFENDATCGGYNDNTQTGTASFHFRLYEPEIISASWSGIGERYMRGFEYMSIEVDDVELGRASSPGDIGSSNPCEDGYGPVISTPSSPQERLLEAGVHKLFIYASTGDNLYHQNCWYQFDLTFRKVS